MTNLRGAFTGCLQKIRPVFDHRDLSIKFDGHILRYFNRLSYVWGIDRLRLLRR